MNLRLHRDRGTAEYKITVTCKGRLVAIIHRPHRRYDAALKLTQQRNGAQWSVARCGIRGVFGRRGDALRAIRKALEAKLASAIA